MDGVVGVGVKDREQRVREHIAPDDGFAAEASLDHVNGLIQPQLPVAPGGIAKQVQLQGLIRVSQAADGRPGLRQE